MELMWDIVLTYLDIAAYCAAIQQGRFIHDLCHRAPRPNRYCFVDSSKPLPRLARSWARAWPTSLFIDALKYRGSSSYPGFNFCNNPHLFWSCFQNVSGYSSIVYLAPNVDCWQMHWSNITALMRNLEITRIWFQRWDESVFSQLSCLVDSLKAQFQVGPYSYQRVILRIMDIGYMPVHGLCEFLEMGWTFDDLRLRGNFQLEVWVKDKPVFAGYHLYTGPAPDLSMFASVCVSPEPWTDDEESGMYSNTESDEENPLNV